MSTRNNSPRRGTWKLLFGTLALAAIWLGVLPQVANWRPIRTMIDRNESAGIDPSAMYYTDLENLEFRDGMLRFRQEQSR